jgi:PKD repeat protein
MRINKTALVSLLLGSLFCAQGFAAWEQPIKIADGAGDYFDITSVKINSQNQVYVLYKAGNQIHLSQYDGSSVSFVKNVSDSKLLCYSPFMFMTADDELHMIWVECSNYNANTQYIKYRYFNGTWSSVATISALTISGTLPGGYVNRKIESMRLAVDSGKNLFIVLQANPVTKCLFISRYGTQTTVENWVVTERSKLPDLAADDHSIHVVWQAKLSGADGYTIKYAKKVNARNGKWYTPIDVKNGQNLANSAHAPRITLDSSDRPHVFYMDDDPAGKGRNIYYRYFASGKFSERFKISDNGKGYYSNLAVRIVSSGDAILVDHLGAGIKCNWKVDGQWTGHENIGPVAASPDNESADLTPDGKIAAVACSSDRDAVYLHLSGEMGPSDNQPPTASFSHTPASGPAPLKVAFNASASTDADGQVVSYSWNFGDGSSGSGVTVTHTYQSMNSYQATLTVTDNDGAHGTATGLVTVLATNRPPVARFTLAPASGHAPLKVSFSAANSTDSDGTIVSYRWNFGDGYKGSGATTWHIYKSKSRRQATLTVTDNYGATGTVTRTVDVLKPNVLPVARFTLSPAAGHAKLKVSFNAAKSTDSDGRVVSYSWNFGDGYRGSGAIVEHTYKSKNRCKAILTVIDDDGGQDTAAEFVNVLAPNHPPVASFTLSPDTGYTPLKVSFNANHSNDSDGRIVSYKWDFGDGKTASGRSVTHLFSEKKRFQVILTATDDDGATDTAAGYVRVLNHAPTAKISYMPVSGLYPLSVSFTADGSSDMDGRIASYQWDFGDGAKGTGISPSHLYLNKGLYQVLLTVTDDYGDTAGASGLVEVFDLNPPLAVQFARQVNRNLFSIEYLYRVAWKANPRNQEIGANIVFYKIYRRDAGSSAGYSFLFAFPANNQTDYEYYDRSLGSMPYEFEYRISALDSAGRESDPNGQGTRVTVPE